MKTPKYKTRKLSEIDFNALRDEILKNKRQLKAGKIDPYQFMGDITLKHAKDKGYNTRTTADANPIADIIFSMFDLYGIELD